MHTYISILRGINVSGKNPIKMDALKKMYENIGFTNVITYIQSGNVIFDSKLMDTNTLAQKIHSEITTIFGFDVLVLVLTADKLQQIIAENPFVKDANKDVAFMHVTFLAQAPVTNDFPALLAKKAENEEINITNDAVYLYCPNGYVNTKITNAFIENKLKTTATTRNWKTTNELLKLAQKQKS